MTAELHFAVSQFLYQKSELCDRYDWDAYLELYDEDSEYHIPQWIDDHRYVCLLYTSPNPRDRG